MAHAQKPDFVFPRNGRVHLNRWGRQFNRLLAAEVCASAWVMTTFGDGVRVLATHSIRQFPLHFISRASPCAIRFRTSSTGNVWSFTSTTFRYHCGMAINHRAAVNWSTRNVWSLTSTAFRYHRGNAINHGAAVNWSTGNVWSFTSTTLRYRDMAINYGAAVNWNTGNV